MYIYVYYTGVDPKHELGNKKEEQRASRVAREPRTGDPGRGDPRTGDPLGGITGRDHW